MCRAAHLRYRASHKGLFYLGCLFSLWKRQAPELAAELKKLPEGTRRQNIRINACAVWDTVSSLGLPVATKSAPKSLGFVHSDLCPGIIRAFQALSLHEHRRPFLPIVWKFPNNVVGNHASLQQCWFAGYHGDIGGGRKADSLAHFALIWMISKLGDFLSFDIDVLFDTDPQIPGWKLSQLLTDKSCKNGFYTRASPADSLLITTTVKAKTDATSHAVMQRQRNNYAAILATVQAESQPSQVTSAHASSTSLVWWNHMVLAFTVACIYRGAAHPPQRGQLSPFHQQERVP